MEHGLRELQALRLVDFGRCVGLRISPPDKLDAGHGLRGSAECFAARDNRTRPVVKSQGSMMWESVS